MRWDHPLFLKHDPSAPRDNDGPIPFRTASSPSRSSKHLHAKFAGSLELGTRSTVCKMETLFVEFPHLLGQTAGLSQYSFACSIALGEYLCCIWWYVQASCPSSVHPFSSTPCRLLCFEYPTAVTPLNVLCIKSRHAGIIVESWREKPKVLEKL